jgi:hypothetical protein
VLILTSAVALPLAGIACSHDYRKRHQDDAAMSIEIN